MTLDAFRAQYPEFKSAGDVLVQIMLDAAASQISSDYWADYYDQGHGLLTAHMLAMAPNGQMARLQTDKAETTYWRHFVRVRDEITFADRVF